MNTVLKELKKDIIEKIEELPHRDIKELYDYIVFLEMKNFIPQIDSSQMYFWTKKWQKMEQEAKKDIETGAIFGPHNSVKSLLKHLSKR